MILEFINNISSIIGLVFTLLNLFATLNVRSQIIHFNERKTFQANFNQIIGKLEGFSESLLKDGLNSDSFYRTIDVYMVDLTSKYTFFNAVIKKKCKHISDLLQFPQPNSSYRSDVAKNLTQLKNLLSKEV